MKKIYLSLLLGISLFGSTKGLENFNSSLSEKKEPTIKATSLDCTNSEAKDFVKTMLTDIETTFIGGYKTLKATENTSYCTATYKAYNQMNKIFYWILKEDNSTAFVTYQMRPIKCDDIFVEEQLNNLAKKRKITIEEIGGYEQVNDETEETTYCSLAYKTSDLKDVVKLTYELKRNEDFKPVIETNYNEEEN